MSRLLDQSLWTPGRKFDYFLNDRSPQQLEMMKKGGNARLKNFFQKYNIALDGPLDFKYKTRAAYYYRDMV